MAGDNEAWHGGRRFRIRMPDGREVELTAKEFLAQRARYNAGFPHATTPSPGAGPRRERDPSGTPGVRPPLPEAEAAVESGPPKPEAAAAGAAQGGAPPPDGEAQSDGAKPA